MTDDVAPFPIQGEYGSTRDRRERPACTIPHWLAELAHREYARQHHRQTLDELGARGGFGRAELVALIRGDYSSAAVGRAQDDLDEEK